MDIQNTTVKETKVVQATPGGQVETHTVSTKSPVSDFFVNKTNQVIMSIVTIIDLLVAIRFIFTLLNANNVGVVSFIYMITDLFVAPFRGIFASPTAGGAYFDLASILAIVIWTVFAVILCMVIDLFSTKKESMV
jgi:hypothetical protein